MGGPRARRPQKGAGWAPWPLILNLIPDDGTGTRGVVLLVALGSAMGVRPWNTRALRLALRALYYSHCQ